MGQAIPFDPSVESVPAEEPMAIAEAVSLLRHLMDQQFQKTGRRLRGVHVKAHACLKAEFEVLPALPPELAQGLFATPAKYPSIVRFSNGSGAPRPDAAPDTRGLALKVEDVSGKRIESDERRGSQDFVMANHWTFFAKDAKGYLQFMQDSTQAGEHPLRFAADLVMRLLRPSEWPVPLLSSIARATTQIPRHPAAWTCSSLAPIRFGDFVAKYQVVPDSKTLGASSSLGARFLMSKNSMRQLLRESLRKQDIRLRLEVQLRTNERSMPVEDATVRWPESESPYHPVALVHIPRQDVPDTDDPACESRAFDVWNALDAHRPLGGINRLRKAIYAASVEQRGSRSERNGPPIA